MEKRRFGFGGTSRPSAIPRPPSTYKTRPQTQSMSSLSSIPSSTSSRKANNNNILFNLPGSGSSRGSRLSNSALGGGGNGRQSLFGGNMRSNMFSSARKSVTAKLGPLFGLTPQHNNRASYQPNTGSSAQSSRRSSIGGRGFVKDNRPLSDGSYHRQCANKLIEFLTKNGYPNPISKNLSTRPTVAEIAKIFEFLFYYFGWKGKITPMDIEIPKIMALLEYPFPVKKSDLVSFTNGRALGSVLGMLEWLVDALTYGSDMDPIRTFYPNFEGEIDIKHELINLCLRTNDENVDTGEVDNHLEQLLFRKYGTEDDYEQQLEEQEALERELKELIEKEQMIGDIEPNIKTYKSDIKGFDDFIQRMETHIKTNETILENFDKEKAEKLETIKKLEEQKKLLKCKVAEQEFGIEEAVLAKERKQQLEDEIKQELGIIEEFKKGIRESRLECSKYEDKIKKIHSDLDSFIRAMTDLVDSPVLSNYSSNLRQLLDCEHWMQILDSLKSIKSGETNGTNINELEKLFSHKVHELKIAIVQQLSSLQGSVTLTEQQKLNEINLLIEEKEKQLKQNEIQVSQLMSEMENKRKEQVSQTAVHQSECDRTRQLLNEFEGNTKRSHKEVKEDLLELRKQVEEKENLYDSEQKALIKDFENSVIIHKKGIQEFTSILDTFMTEEQTNNTHLNAILAKTGSNTGATKARKPREKRDKKDNKENK